MRRIVPALVGVIVLAFTPKAQAQIGVFLNSGPQGGTADQSMMIWLAASPEVRAVAVSDIVTMSMNPINSGLVIVAADGLALPIPLDLQTFPITLQPGDKLAGGDSLPPGTPAMGPGQGPVPPQPVQPGTPMMGLNLSPPDQGSPGELIVDYTDPDNIQRRGQVSFPDGGWWSIDLPQDDIQNPIEQLPPTTNPNPAIPVPPELVETPEPGSLALSVIGLAVVWRRGRSKFRSPR